MARLTCSEYTAQVAATCEDTYRRLNQNAADAETATVEIDRAQDELDRLELAGAVPFLSRRAYLIGVLSGARKYRRNLTAMPRRG
jgi:hypothetical protein